MSVTIQLNGEPHQLGDNCTVAELIESLRLNPKLLAVERNAQLVPRATHAQVALADGDRIEIVTLVGGG
jgi:thiamine biosynthesis protein ThiS